MDTCRPCIEMLHRRGVADGHTEQCLSCPHGIKIVDGKRVYNVASEAQADVVEGQAVGVVAAEEDT